MSGRDLQVLTGMGIGIIIGGLIVMILIWAMDRRDDREFRKGRDGR
jgi:nitrogen fixation-related uncharacterized protein